MKKDTKDALIGFFMLGGIVVVIVGLTKTGTNSLLFILSGIAITISALTLGEKLLYNQSDIELEKKKKEEEEKEEPHRISFRRI